MELVKIGEKTYYIKNATNIGVYKMDDKNVYLIDTGNDKDAGKKILKLLEENGLTVIGIINTHSHADHIGGNKVIQERTNCDVLAYQIEKCFVEYPILEPSLLYGAYPLKELKNKFLLAKESNVTSIDDNIPNGLEYITLRGHSYDMIGIKTSDDVYFLGDSLFSEETINKYHLFYIYNVREFLATLDFLETLKGKLYIPSHCEVTSDISCLIEKNRNKVYEIIALICSIWKEEKTYEEILKAIFDNYKLTLNVNQYVLVGSTLKAYISYLCEENKLSYKVEENYLTYCYALGKEWNKNDKLQIRTSKSNCNNYTFR